MNIDDLTDNDVERMLCVIPFILLILIMKDFQK